MFFSAKENSARPPGYVQQLGSWRQALALGDRRQPPRAAPSFNASFRRRRPVSEPGTARPEPYGTHVAPEAMAARSGPTSDNCSRSHQHTLQECQAALGGRPQRGSFHQLAV